MVSIREKVAIALVTLSILLLYLASNARIILPTLAVTEKYKQHHVTDGVQSEHNGSLRNFRTFLGNWTELVAFQARRDSLIMVTMLDGKYKYFAKPWYLQTLSIRPIGGFDNSVIIALDDEAYAYGIKANLPIVSYECMVNSCRPIPIEKKRQFHFKISALRILMDLGYDIFLSEMDVLLVKDPFTTSMADDSGNYTSDINTFRNAGQYDMWLSAHCNHPRVNIGVVAIRNNKQTREFFRVYETNWKKSQQWDQSLWDSMLPNYDKLQKGMDVPVNPVTWGKIDARAMTEWQNGFQRGSCTSNRARAPCDQIVAYHLTNMPLEQKHLVMCKFYRLENCKNATESIQKEAEKVMSAMCHASVSPASE